ncbi:MAG: type II toxin-antitoxin system death-on-curing family toxin [Rhodospirillales bacterium]|nr:type II toxin-antitoxin system death-on-curing family toxin [Rhodospirillales bacterium]MCB9995409.1 type II toxin-antitoxin system death-on-curing family toxin [Rhodospirillales bacterium]
MTPYKWINGKALRLLHEESLATFGGRRGMRDESLFESALARPETLLHYNESVDIADLAAGYAYGLAKNHPFVDGNKRIAFLSVGLFLRLNGHRLTATPAEAIKAVLALASADISEKEFAGWIRQNMSP